MKERSKVPLVMMVAVMCCGLRAANSAESAATYIQLNTDNSLAWTTAPGTRVTVPIPYPHGSESASLTITGRRYSVTYPNITGDTYAFDLPAANSAEEERIYTLTLTFDTGDTVSTKLTEIDGYDATETGHTRCLTDKTASDWAFVRKMAVLPIPAGVSSFTMNGDETDTGLNGKMGWFAFEPVAETAYALGYTTDEGTANALLQGYGYGMSVIIR